MDVSLVLTHRCNLACSYCYAGEHHRTEMAAPVRERAVALLFADAPDVIQLSFFGGEPFLAFAAMRAAVSAARARAVAEQRRLILQVTTNATALGHDQIAWVIGQGVRTCVSIDGIREAHEHARPQQNGRSSFDAVVRGLRALVDAGAAPDAMMVVTPATVPYLAQSVEWLWQEGVTRVRANLDLRAEWSAESRARLREQLLEVGAELTRQRREGSPVVFVPLEDVQHTQRRPQVVVGTSGHLYPCSPMVGDDRDDGSSAALRMGHIDEPLADIVSRVFTEGLHCSRKGDCACAAYLETGDRNTLGPMGAEWKRMCAEVAAAVARVAAEKPAAAEDAGAPAMLPTVAIAGAAPALRSVVSAPPSDPRRRRAAAAAVGVLAGAGALGLVAASTPGLLRVVHAKRNCAKTVQEAAPAPLEDGITDGLADLAHAGLTASINKIDNDAAALRARIAAKAAQQAAARRHVARPSPPPRPFDDHIDGGIGMDM